MQIVKNLLTKISIIWVRQAAGIFLILDTGVKYLHQPMVIGVNRWEPDVSWLIFLGALVGLEITHNYFNVETPKPNV